MSGYAMGWAPMAYTGDSTDVTAQHTTPVDIATRVVQGHPAEVLLHAANGAELPVGSRGHGTFAGILLASVSQHCVQHAACPGVVVPQDQPTRDAAIHGGHLGSP